VKFPIIQHIDPGEHILTQTVLLFPVSLISPCFHCTDSYQRLFSLIHWPPCWPNQSRNIWCSLFNNVLWAFESLDAIAWVYIWLIVGLTVVFTLIWIIQIANPVKPIFNVENNSWCTFLLTFAWMTINSPDSVDIQYLSSTSRDVLSYPCGGKGDLSDNVNAAWPTCWKFDQDDLMISLDSEMYSMTVICWFSAWDLFCAGRRFWLPCHFTNNWWTLAIWCNFLSSTSCVNSKCYAVSAFSDAEQLPTNILLLARGNNLTDFFARSVSPVVLDCLQQITRRPRDILGFTEIPCGIIDSVSHATLQRSAYCECLSTCWHHQPVISVNQNVLLISMGSEW